MTRNFTSLWDTFSLKGRRNCRFLRSMMASTGRQGEEPGVGGWGPSARRTR